LSKSSNPSGFLSGTSYPTSTTKRYVGWSDAYLVTADRIDPDNLKIECRVNGETRQSSNTNDLIFNCRQVISFISRYITLKPGDIIFTGTPEGVIIGRPPEKQVWLKPGDKVACSLEKLGELKFDLV